MSAGNEDSTMAAKIPLTLDTAYMAAVLRAARGRGQEAEECQIQEIWKQSNRYGYWTVS